MTLDNVEVERWAVVCTSNVPLGEMLAALENEVSNVTESDGGWRVRVGLDEDIDNLAQHFSGSVVALFEAFALKQFYGVRFDQDAEELEGFPTYDW